MKETMTVHKALSELKVLGGRIEKELDNIEFIAVNKHSSNKVDGQPVADYMNHVRDAYKAICTLVNRRNAIKRAVTNSNAVTLITVGGKKYTVAEAIDMKNVGTCYLRSILGRLDAQWTAAKRTVQRENGEKLESRADAYVKSLYENVDVKNLAEDAKRARETFIEQQQMEILDPISAEKVMAKLRNDLDNFMSEVDAALSVSNALTTIEVEYETV